MIRKTSDKVLGLSRLVPDAASFREKPPAEARVWSMPPACIAPLLSLADVEGVVESGALRVDRVSVARDGERLPKARYGVDPDDPSSRVAADRLQLLLNDGHTVILNGLHECLPSIAEICNRISFELGVDIAANAYLTPPGSMGFGHHYDLHSVLIVQTSGSKTWNLFPPVLVDPIEEQGSREWGWLPPEFLERDIKKGPYLTATLNPGDVLWIPRGWIHSGYATGEHSLHLTLAIEPLTPYWLVGQVLKKMADVPELRVELPWRMADSPDCLKGIAEKALADVAAAMAVMDWGTLVQDLVKQGKRPELKKQDQPLLRTEITSETRLVTKRSVIYGVDLRPEGLNVQLARTSMNIAKSDLRQLAALLQREEDEPWSPRDLEVEMDSATAVRVAERLVRHGVVQLL